MNSQITEKIYASCGLKITDFRMEKESAEYSACQFQINGRKVIYREAKVTPKKTGQFVTFWKRNEAGITTPFHQAELFDFYVITVRIEGRAGQFILPKSVLTKKGIISTEQKDGKRGFRVYPLWDLPQNKQALKTQQWQLEYFYELGNQTDLMRVNTLFGGE